MVSAVPNPALDAFISRIAPEFVFAQALIRAVADGFDVRNVADRSANSLRLVSARELREIAQYTQDKQFRALKSAPTLQGGWYFVAHNSTELEFALQCLYPSAVADWFAAKQTPPPITHYRDFVARQTGMYRGTAMLTNNQVADVALAGCHRRFCLKQRLWRAEGLAADGEAEKSAIPCLEPCALMLEFARTMTRVEDRREYAVSLTATELTAVRAALEKMIDRSRVNLREGDFSVPDSPRRIQLLLDKLGRFVGSR